MKYSKEDYYTDYDPVFGATCNRLMDEVNKLHAELDKIKQIVAEQPRKLT